jgi:hypothetical protein
MPAEVIMGEPAGRNLVARTIAMIGAVGGALCLLAGPGGAQEAIRRLSLDEALALALRQNRTVRAKVAELRYRARASPGDRRLPRGDLPARGRRGRPARSARLKAREDDHPARVITP